MGYSGDMFPAELEFIMIVAANPLIGLVLPEELLECNAALIAVSPHTGRVFVDPLYEYDRGAITNVQILQMVIEFAVVCADKNSAGVIAEFRQWKDLP
jgi:hypothetical protein